jgi:hypothetical protein
VRRLLKKSWPWCLAAFLLAGALVSLRWLQSDPYYRLREGMSAKEAHECLMGCVLPPGDPFGACAGASFTRTWDRVTLRFEGGRLVGKSRAILPPNELCHEVCHELLHQLLRKVRLR